MKTSSGDGSMEEGGMTTAMDAETEEGFEEVAKKGQNDDAVAESRDYGEEMRVKLKRFMMLSTFGKAYENAFILLSLFSCAQFIYETYRETTPDTGLTASRTGDPPSYDGSAKLVPEAGTTDYYFDYIEIILAICFMWDWLLQFFLADSKAAHFTSFYSMIDLLTVIPIWVTRTYTCMDYNNIKTPRDQIVYILCAITTTRILRVLRVRRKLLRIEDLVSRTIAEITLNIVVSMFFFAALIQFLETQDQYHQFHTWLYYIMVTMTSVGYGDIFPLSVIGRILVMGLIAVAFVAGPQMSSDLVEKLGRQSVYARAKYSPKARSTHVYVCGDVETTSIMAFMDELFHEDHDDDNIHAVVMSPNPPNSDMLLILRDPVFSLRVTFLEGSALSEKDLQRAKVREAQAIFIMCNKFALDPDEEDAKTILQQFYLKKYVMRKHSLEKPLFAMQLIRPESARHLTDSSAVEGSATSKTYKEDIILCLNEIKMGIIAKAVMFPGANTLLMNLLTSFADDDDDDEGGGSGGERAAARAADGGAEGAETENLDEDDQDNWVGEYQTGCGWEIYSTELSPILTGISFAVLAETLYQRIGIVLFGVKIEDLAKDKSHVRMLLNPADFVIPDHEDCRVEAFVIAENKNRADLTFSGNKDDGTSGGGGGGGGGGGAEGEDAVALQMVAVAQQRENQRQEEKEPGGGGGGDGTSSSSPGKKNRKKEHEWQALLHKYDSRRNNSSGASSEQEMQKQIEEEYMKANFYANPGLLVSTIESCTILTSLEHEAPYVREHTLIIGKNLSNLFDLVQPLRASYLGYIRPIVILTPNPISKAVWSRVGIFQGIFVIQGSMLEELDVVRAGIFKARHCIVLADQSEEAVGSTMTSGAKATLSALTDADAIFSYQQVMAMNPTISVCIEVVNVSNAGFLDPKEGMISGEVDYKFTPQFASGALLVSSLLDTLVCQAFFNRSIVSVIRLFVSGVEVRDRGSIRAKILGLDSAERGGEKKGVAALVGSSLYQMKVPDSNTGKPYGELFKSLAKVGIIPVGLYRGVFKDLAVGPKQNKMPYVFTNPPKETEVFSCDKVFVLSQKPILGGKKEQMLLGKRTDWSLQRMQTFVSPEERMGQEYTEKKERGLKRLDRLDAKMEGLLMGLKEVTGMTKFNFEKLKDQAEAEAYRRLHEGEV